VHVDNWYRILGVDSVEGYGYMMWGIAQRYRVSLQGRHKHMRSGTLLQWSAVIRCNDGLKAFSWTANSRTK
jgi:hypothetical protein